ncbi:TetR/AcrR family transcriptional regulator [Nocardioidaceae bacterium]|nr:TetR/AcrR family transcriptional regulator [Nocardioidaceae bacterium]
MADHASRQEERSAATRRALLDATIACLVEEGYGGTTGPAVAKRAGLSRGAQLHHFGTRDQMVVAAVEHLAQMRLAAVRSRLQEIENQSADDPGVAQPVARAALELLAGALSGPLYAATLELWVAARANVELREELVPAEHRVRAELWEVCRRYVTEDPVEIQLTLDVLLGQGVSGMFHADRAESHRRALDRWERLLVDRSTSARPC